MGVGIPPLEIKNLIEAKPCGSRVSVCGLAVVPATGRWQSSNKGVHAAKHAETCERSPPNCPLQLGLLCVRVIPAPGCVLKKTRSQENGKPNFLKSKAGG